MEYLTRLIRALAVLSLFCLILPQKACAYIDPSTGNLAVQMLMAVLVGGFFMVKAYWNKIKVFFKNLFSRGQEQEKDDD